MQVNALEKNKAADRRQSKKKKTKPKKQKQKNKLKTTTTEKRDCTQGMREIIN